MRATIGGALALPAACDQFGVPAWTQLFVVVVAYVAAFLAWVVFTDAYRGLGSIPILFTLFVALALGIWLILSLMLPVFRFVALVGGIIMLTLAWFVRILNWTTLSPLGNVRSAGLHRSAVRHSVGGTVAVVVASILVLLAWPG